MLHNFRSQTTTKKFYKRNGYRREKSKSKNDETDVTLKIINSFFM